MQDRQESNANADTSWCVRDTNGSTRAPKVYPRYETKNGKLEKNDPPRFGVLVPRALSTRSACPARAKDTDVVSKFELIYATEKCHMSICFQLV